MRLCLVLWLTTKEQQQQQQQKKTKTNEQKIIRSYAFLYMNSRRTAERNKTAAG